MKATLISIAIRFVMGAIALGVGIWYLSSSIGGAALTYTSMDGFLSAIGVRGGDIATANGCFMCNYVAELFNVIGNAAEMFWTAMVDNIWILMAVGFGIFIFIYTAQYIFDAAKKTATLDAKEKKLEFRGWFDKIWRQGARVMIVGVLMGAIGMGGTSALRTVSSITITPVLFVGTELSMAATGVSDGAACRTIASDDDAIMAPVMGSFMCVIGNISAVMLAGAAGGFSLMNYAWLGLGGGVFTWVAGLTLVIMFLLIGFDLFFQILSVLFKLIFLIIFLPLILAAAAFEPVWKLASGVLGGAINMLVKSAIQIVGITLKVLLIYATVSYSADAFFPGPVDGYSAMLPPMMGMAPENPDMATMSVMNVFSTCEQVATNNGTAQMNADAFRDCFTAQRAAVERKHPGAFDFMDDGWGFLMLMIGLFVLYYYVVSPKIDEILGATKPDTSFDFGGQIKLLGQKIWSAPRQIFDAISRAMAKKG